MKSPRKTLMFLLAIAMSGVAGYAFLKNAARESAQTAPRKIVCYQDSMHPWIKSDSPGKCTICAMDLTPIYEGQPGFHQGDDLVVLSSNHITVLNVQCTEVQRQPLTRSLRVAGTLEANETRRAIIAAPAQGRVQSVGVDYTGLEVQEGQPLITLLSAELIQKRAYIRSANVQDVRYTRDSASGEKQTDPFSSVLPAPFSGTVIERAVVPGQYVLEGERLLTIVDPSVLWFRFDVYEAQLPWFQPGQKLEVTLAAVPGKVFPAVISFIDPSLNEATRTVKIRADIQNPVVATNGHPQRLLRFGMYAEGRLQAQVEKVVAVPRSAILFPGGAAYAYVDNGAGAYQRRRVKLGRQGDQLWEVLHGLKEGDRVVTSGNVLIDAQAQFTRSSADDDPEPCDDVVAHSEEDQAEATGLMLVGTAAQPRSLPGGGLSPAQIKALQEFLGVADGISRALAADSLDQLRPLTAKLPGAVSPLKKTFAANHPWQTVLQRIEAASDWHGPTDLATARKAFLPFSTNVVELVQQLRAQEEVFRSLKVYFCPMAPKPGLWFQAKGPLRNPYYGAKMLQCGEEVPPPAAKPVAVHVQANAAPKETDACAEVSEPEHAMAAESSPHAGLPADPVSAPGSDHPMAPNRKGPNRLEAAYARWAQTEEMRAKRWTAIAEAYESKAATTNGSAAKASAPPLISIKYEDLVRMPAPNPAATARTNAIPDLGSSPAK